jgi:hypothetical protein
MARFIAPSLCQPILPASEPLLEREREVNENEREDLRSTERLLPGRAWCQEFKGFIDEATTTSPICLLFGRTFVNITYLRARIERLCEAEEEKDSQQKRPGPHRHPYVHCGQAGVGC